MAALTAPEIVAKLRDRIRTTEASGQVADPIYAQCVEVISAAIPSANPDPEDDARDGILFRFWIRAASYPGGWPSRLAALIQEHGPKDGENMQPKHYRAALLALAKEKGVNLP